MNKPKRKIVVFGVELPDELVDDMLLDENDETVATRGIRKAVASSYEPIVITPLPPPPPSRRKPYAIRLALFNIARVLHWAAFRFQSWSGHDAGVR